MVKLPPTILIQETDFHNAWARAVRAVLRDGKPMIIGDVSEPKPIRDACVSFELTGSAIRQIERRELHSQFPFQHIDPYCEEYTREFLEEYVKKPEEEKFSYLYFELLTMYSAGAFIEQVEQLCQDLISQRETDILSNSLEQLVSYIKRMAKEEFIDQIEWLRQNLAEQKETGISSNRCQAITWQPKIDLGNVSPPCLQRIWIRYLDGNDVEVHLSWRSRDLYTAWQANIIAVIDMLNREVIHPNGCRIAKLVDKSNSLHTYDSDEYGAGKVKSPQINPQMMGR